MSEGSFSTMSQGSSLQTNPFHKILCIQTFFTKPLPQSMSEGSFSTMSQGSSLQINPFHKILWKGFVCKELPWDMVEKLPSDMLCGRGFVKKVWMHKILWKGFVCKEL